ncbi:hypothetical protein AK830_g10284 [Neonectria ditissima]|uniref:Apple domain-containing protein n=1 Tax=Neonectria ditissima TaxID=78410 RepID=A0A0P7B7A0_9HYPO|nr:hypothetical protein AK830_g10284 [Neonectria ditissima]
MMATVHDSEGLQVDHTVHASNGAQKAPEFMSQYPPNSNYYAPTEQRQQRLPFGLGVWAFGFLVAAITAIVVGGGVGGGLGAALASCHSSDCSAAPAETSACPKPDSSNDTAAYENGALPYTPISATKVNLTLDCPEGDESREIKSSDGFKFDMYCGIDAAMGSTADGGGQIADIGLLIAYTIEDCLQACVQLINLNSRVEDVQACDSVAFSSSPREYLKSWGGNCWLKRGKKERGQNWQREDIPNWAYAELT